MNISDIINSTDRYTFHSHSQWCDGRATIAEFAEAAAASGMEHYGITPHSPVPIVSPCNMSMNDVSTYLAEVKRLKDKYAGRVEIYAGMEIDYLGKHWGPHDRYFRELPLDFSIGSVHFIPAQDGQMVDIDGHYDSFRRKMTANFRDDLSYVVNTFFDQSEKMLMSGGFDIVGHIDKVAHNAAHHQPGIDSEPWFEQRVERLITMAFERGYAIEINTKALSGHNRLFPDKKWWPLLKRLGAVTPVNSDAHEPTLINAGRRESLAELSKIS